MTKKFAARTKKRDRIKVDLADLLGDGNVFSRSDEKLLEGALIERVLLKNIKVKQAGISYTNYIQRCIHKNSHTEWIKRYVHKRTFNTRYWQRFSRSIIHMYVENN